MQITSGQLAVVTGGGTGMGRAIAGQLVEAGVSVAMCDVSEANMAESAALARERAAQDARVETFVADVADPDRMDEFGEFVAEAFQTDAVNLVLNNAGIGGGAEFVNGDRQQWERVFDVCWGGVYNGSRTFTPMLVAAEVGHLVNVSSVNGLWASLGPNAPHTAYSAAKFAVRGFTESLVNDFRLNAPHVGVSVVMPGHIGTSIVLNSTEAFATEMDEGARAMVTAMGEYFRDQAPTTAEQAATIILDGVREGRWRILVGEDAQILDALVREAPEEVYEASFMDRQRAAGGVGLQL